VREELTELEPGNTTYRRDLSVSYDRLADLALAAGRSGDAERSTGSPSRVAEELTELEPGNTTYRRDLSISYERLAALEAQAGRHAEAQAKAELAVALRNALLRREPGRLDLAEDLAYSLYLAADVAGNSVDAGPRRDQTRRDVVTILEPFEQVGLLSDRGAQILAWART
jgi:hypothetical protein